MQSILDRLFGLGHLIVEYYLMKTHLIKIDNTLPRRILQSLLISWFVQDPQTVICVKSFLGRIGRWGGTHTTDEPSYSGTGRVFYAVNAITERNPFV